MLKTSFTLSLNILFSCNLFLKINVYIVVGNIIQKRIYSVKFCDPQFVFEQNKGNNQYKQKVFISLAE